MKKEFAWLIIGLMTIIVSASNSQIISTENASIPTQNIKATQEICTSNISQNSQETTTESVKSLTKKVALAQ